MYDSFSYQRSVEEEYIEPEVKCDICQKYKSYYNITILEFFEERDISLLICKDCYTNLLEG